MLGIFKKKASIPKNDKDNPDYGTMQLLSKHEEAEEQQEEQNEDDQVLAEDKLQTELEMV